MSRTTARTALILVVLGASALSAATPARAQPRVAVAIDEPPGRGGRERALRGTGARMSGGLALIEDHSYGGYGRLEFERFTERPPEVGFVGGVVLGLEGWGASDSGGGGLPMMFYGGFHSRYSIFATIGFGWSWAIYDRVDGDGGFGIFVPTTGVVVGVDLRDVRLLLEGRAQYRWQWGADDRYQLQAGLTFAYTSLL